MSEALEDHLADLSKTTEAGFGEDRARGATARYVGSFDEQNFELSESTNIGAIREALLREALAATTAVVESASAHRETLIDRALLSTSMSVREISRLTGVDPRRLSAKRKRLAPPLRSPNSELGEFLAGLPQGSIPPGWDFARLVRFATTPDDTLQGMSPIEWFRADRPIDAVTQLLPR